MPNRLGAETSPYLRQHAGNPVDWWPWCEPAWEEARRLDRPVLLSVGYSACHWCHVMAHESFENEQIAALMNRLYVCIKVDREERPDVDSVYMQAVQALSGQGGWPMTVFCTPRGVPYFGGTYFPPEDRQGMRGFPDILVAAERAYREQRDAVESTGQQLRQALAPPRLRAEGEPAVEQLDQAATRLRDQTDMRDGGFGGAPKFPHPAAVDVLLRRYRATGRGDLLAAAEVTLDRMARGGLYDQVGGGFHRYSVDARWAVPHFEKMLYDNAQLVPVYLHAFQLTGEERWRRVCEETLEYLRREMLLPGGGFASAQDADTEGGEGAFFVWTPAQLHEVLGDADATLAQRVFGVATGGNFEHGTTVLSLPYPLEQVARSLGVDATALQADVDSVRSRLFAARAPRPAPGRDDKVVTSWNALTLAAFAEAGAALERPELVEVARRCATFLLEQVVVDGRLRRTWMDGDARVPAFLEDVAALAGALLTLYEATGEPRWFGAARSLCDDMLERFHDPGSGFSDTAVDAEPLLVRPRTLDDNPVPAGQSSAALALMRLHAFTGEDRLRTVALQVVTPLAAAVARSPLALGNLAQALEWAVTPPREVAVAGDPRSPAGVEMLRLVRTRWDPVRVLACGEEDSVPLLAGRPGGDGATAYVCRGFVCDAPARDAAELGARLEAAGG